MRILCLVPTALAASRGARRLCDAQDGVLLGPAVATLEALAPAVLASAGDPRPVLPPLAEAILAAEAGRAAGGALAAAQPGSGLGAALARSIAELRRAQIAPADTRRAAAGLSGAAVARLEGLSAALEGFEARIESLGVLDRAAAAREAAGAVRRGAAREWRRLDLLVVDGFVALAPAEWDLLAALASRSRRTRVHAPYVPERPELCAPAEPLLRRLEGLHDLGARREIEVVLAHADARSPLPAALLAAFAGGMAPAAAQGGRVLAATGAGEEGEAAAVAALAARLVEEGVAPDDVAVLAPSPRRSARALAAAFAEAGVPFAAGRGAPLAEAPPVAAVLDALGAAASGLSRARAERIAAAGWLAPGLPAVLGPMLDRAGALEGRLAPAEALRHRADAITASRERADLARASASLEALAALLRSLGTAATGRQHAARLGSFLDATGVRRRAARGEAALAARDLAAVARLSEAADGVASALALTGRGGARIAPAEWSALLDLAVAGATLPPSGDPAAGAVELWGLDEAPVASARAAIVAGCEGGSWPPPPPPEPLLRDPERIALNRATHGLRLATSGARRAEALHRAFCAVAAGREVVAFTWPGPGPAGDGGALAPLAADALAAVGVAPPDRPDEAGEARTPRQALRAAARLARAGRGEDAAAAIGVSLASRLGDARARGAIEAERREAVAARRASPFSGRIGESAAAALHAVLPDEWSPTDLEGYARCPFRLFLQRAVRLPDPSAPDLEMDGRDEGSLLHAVLERFVAARVARGAWPPSGGPADVAEARGAAEEVLARFGREGRAGDAAVLAARWPAVLARLDRIVAAEARDAGDLRPALLEHRFGGSSSRPPLAIEAAGDRVLLQGRIDRVDAAADRLLVVDYKNARRGEAYRAMLDPGSFGATSFQVPIYALEAARALPGRRVEATFALLRKAERMEPVGIVPAELLGEARPCGGDGAPPEPSPGRPERDGGGEGGGVASFAGSVVGAVRRIRSGDFPVASLDCAGCPYGAVCRFQGAAERGGGEVAA